MVAADSHVAELEWCRPEEQALRGAAQGNRPGAASAQKCCLGVESPFTALHWTCVRSASYRKHRQCSIWRPVHINAIV